MTSRLARWTAVSLVVLTAACGREGQPSAPSAEQTQAAAVARVAGAPAVQAPVIQQQIIRTAELRVEVHDARKAAQAADSIATRYGATIGDTRVSQETDDRRVAQLTIRVPAEHMGEVLVALRKLGDVKEETTSAQDVTREYTDLTTRLAVKEQEVGRLRAMLDARTAKLADVLEVERELTRAVTELEQMKGEQRYYDSQIARSTITVTFIEPAPTRGSQLGAPVAEAIHDSLGVLGRSLSAVVYVIAFALPWLLVALLVWYVRARWRARHGAGATTFAFPKPTATTKS